MIGILYLEWTLVSIQYQKKNETDLVINVRRRDYQSIVEIGRLC